MGEIMTAHTVPMQATVEDLYRVPDNGKAELVNGEIVLMSPTGDVPSRAGGEIYISLRQHERRTGGGRAYPDNAGFEVHLPHRKSFSPDAAWHTGQLTGMRFLQGAPVFAVEMRSENDYGPAAERDMAAKRADYFATGTLVVWDVNMQSDDIIKKYSANDPDNPVVFRRGETANAEPAVPGWIMGVDDLFA